MNHTEDTLADIILRHGLRFADVTGLSPGTLSALSRGKTRHVTASTITKLARALKSDEHTIRRAVVASRKQFLSANPPLPETARPCQPPNTATSAPNRSTPTTATAVARNAVASTEPRDAITTQSAAAR